MEELVGPYRILEVLGRGGMGIVYRGVHDRLERPVAVKKLAPELTRNPQFQERFFSEARTQAQLQHPNIIAIYDLLEDAGEYYIVMEYFQGRGLDEILGEHQGRGLPEDRVLTLFRQVLEALNAAHAEGVIHRDVKPSNVMVDRDDHIKLMDFGIALLVGDKRLTQSSQTIGTPVYMSPEQILRPREMDHRTDIYSAAIMLYEMLAGIPPFDAETEYEIKKLHVEAAIVPALERLEHVRPAIRNALRRALEKDPQERFHSAREFLDAVDEGSSRDRHSAPSLPPAAPAPTVAVETLPPAPSATSPLGSGKAHRPIWHWAVGGTAILLTFLVGIWLLASPKTVQSPTETQTTASTSSKTDPAPRPLTVQFPESPSKPATRLDSTDSTSEKPPDETSSESSKPDPEEPTSSAPEPQSRESSTAPETEPKIDPRETERQIQTQLVARVRSRVHSTTQEAERLLSSGQHDTAQRKVQEAITLSSKYRSEFVDELVTLRLLEDRIMDSMVQERTERKAAEVERQTWESRVEEVEGLLEEKSYPEARKLAVKLLEDVNLPRDLAPRVRELRDQAQQELENIWGNAQVDSKEEEVFNPKRKKKKQRQ